MTIVDGLRIIDSNAQTGTTWWNWTIMHILCKKLALKQHACIRQHQYFF
jgi:hypothetical protein